MNELEYFAGEQLQKSKPQNTVPTNRSVFSLRLWLTQTHVSFAPSECSPDHAGPSGSSRPKSQDGGVKVSLVRPLTSRFLLTQHEAALILSFYPRVWSNGAWIRSKGTAPPSWSHQDSKEAGKAQGVVFEEEESWDRFLDDPVNMLTMFHMFRTRSDNQKKDEVCCNLRLFFFIFLL